MIDRDLLKIAMDKVIQNYQYDGVKYKDWDDFENVFKNAEGEEAFLKVAKWRIPSITKEYLELYNLEQEILKIFETT